MDIWKAGKTQETNPCSLLRLAHIFRNNWFWSLSAGAAGKSSRKTAGQQTAESSKVKRKEL